MIKYKTKCGLCRKNMALVTYAKQFPVCKECQMKQLKQKITDPYYKKLFNIDPKLFEENDFLRSIKINYLRFEGLTDRQVEAFKRTVEELKDPKLKVQREAERNATKKQKLADKQASKNPFYKFIITDLNGNSISFNEFKGKVVLIVNVASKCRYTPQYKGLQKLYDKYKDKGFVVLGFPANDFGNEEPGTNEEIKEFCSTNYKVTFPMFGKIEVTEYNKHSLYKFLTTYCESSSQNGPVKWNFEKFLINQQGLIVDRFESAVEPEDIEREIKRLL